MARMVAGDEVAFAEFGERYPPALYRFTAARVGNDPDLTRDLVQNAVTKALGKLETYRAEASLLTWLCACCRNEFLMHLRRQRGSVVGNLSLSDLAGREPVVDEPDPEVVTLAGERRLLVHMVLDALPAHYARVLEWKYLDERPVAEIAARLDLETKAAESLLTRARAAFRVHFEDLRSRGRRSLERRA